MPFALRLVIFPFLLFPQLLSLLPDLSYSRLTVSGCGREARRAALLLLCMQLRTRPLIIVVEGPHRIVAGGVVSFNCRCTGAFDLVVGGAPGQNSITDYFLIQLLLNIAVRSRTFLMAAFFIFFLVDG